MEINDYRELIKKSTFFEKIKIFADLLDTIDVNDLDNIDNDIITIFDENKKFVNQNFYQIKRNGIPVTFTKVKKVY